MSNRKPPTVRFVPPPGRNPNLVEKIGILLSINRLLKGAGTTQDKQKMNDIIARYIAPIIRHGLTAAGGWLVAHGLPGPTEQTIADLTTIATGAVVFGVGLLWSFVEKQFRK